MVKKKQKQTRRNNQRQRQRRNATHKGLLQTHAGCTISCQTDAHSRSSPGSSTHTDICPLLVDRKLEQRPCFRSAALPTCLSCLGAERINTSSLVISGISFLSASHKAFLSLHLYSVPEDLLQEKHVSSSSYLLLLSLFRALQDVLQPCLQASLFRSCLCGRTTKCETSHTQVFFPSSDLP